MSGQIVNVSNSEAISEIALKCGDPFFRDFPRNIYSQAVYRSQRGIAKEFGILDRIWTYTNEDGTSPINVTPLNLNGVWKIDVVREDVTTEYDLRRLEDVLESVDTTEAIYHILYNANQHMLYYTNAAEDDVVTVYYTSSIAGEEDYEPYDNDGNEIAVPVLPNKYFEEVIRRGVRYIAQLGLATFEADKAQKYQRVLQMYTRSTDEAIESNLEKSRPFILIKPFQYP